MSEDGENKNKKKMKQTLLEPSDRDMMMTFRFDAHGSSPRILRSKSVLMFLPSLLRRSVWERATLLGHPV